MKRFIFTLIVVVLAAACDKETVDPVLTVEPLTIELSKSCLSAEFTVKATATDYTISPSEKWIHVTLVAEDEDGDRYSVSADEYNVDDKRSGKIVIVPSAGISKTTLRVFQQGDIPNVVEPDNIWDRSARARLNLNGRVKTVSTIYNIFAADATIENVEFNKLGQITSFQNESYNGSLISYKAEYDDAGRLSKFTQTLPGVTKKAEFHYGNHGKYIAADNLLYDLSYQVYMADRVGWLPRMIKNLESIEISVNDSKSEIRYTVSEDGTSGKASGLIDHELKFDGNYNSYVLSHYPGYNDNIYLYKVNPSDGCLVEMQEGIPGGNLAVCTYNDDRLNTLAAKKTAYPHETYVCTYNEHLDLVKCDYEDGNYDFSVNYEYDSYGNWIKMVISRSSGTKTIERTISYWD